MLLRVLIAAPSKLARSITEMLDGPDVLVSLVDRGVSVWAALGQESCDLLLVDEGRFEGGAEAGIGDVRDMPGGPEVVVLSRTDDPTHRAELLAAEAFAVIHPDTSPEELRDALTTIVERCAQNAHHELLAEREEGQRLSDFSTSSPVMREFLSLARRVVQADSTLLVQGETGVGKEYLSRAIHAESPRALSPFVPVNCSALSESLLESELFGHVEGAFTGAIRARRGYFELAHRGTLFIDEVGELSPQLQVKLLRVIQERSFQPVGSEEEIHVDVRIIAATNRDLMAEMEAGRFRPDLFYRLSVVRLEVPPLRERREDIENLVLSHIEHFRRRMNREVTGIDDAALRLLQDYHWPGNVRELMNVMERAVLLCERAEIGPADLPEEIRQGTIVRALTTPQEARTAQLEPEEDEDLPFSVARKRMIESWERRTIVRLLSRNNGRVLDTARRAGLNPRSLYEKMRRLGIRKESFKVREARTPSAATNDDE